VNSSVVRISNSLFKLRPTDITNNAKYDYDHNHQSLTKIMA